MRVNWRPNLDLNVEQSVSAAKFVMKRVLSIIIPSKSQSFQSDFVGVIKSELINVRFIVRLLPSDIVPLRRPMQIPDQDWVGVDLWSWTDFTVQDDYQFLG